MMKDRTKRLARRTVAAGMTASAAIAIAAIGRRPAPAPPAAPPGPFTDAQAQAGQAAYAQNCAKCHDSGEAPPLNGAGFLNVWASRSTHDLFARVKDTMPVDNPGSLSNETVVPIIAWLLKNNGVAAGPIAFTPTSAVAIITIAPSEAPQQAGGGRRRAGGEDDASAAGGPRSADAELRRGNIPFRTGITVEGTVAKYTPITEEMMVHPPAADWLMHYGNYAGWSHSPLKQITPKNVQNLQLRWVWSMDDGERQQITPLVHEGVMFVSNNITNRVQALNAKTGDLIWENTLGPRLENQVNATARTMALYGDQLFYPASDATLYALAARTGKVNWLFFFSVFGRVLFGGLLLVFGLLFV